MYQAVLYFCWVWLGLAIGQEITVSQGKLPIVFAHPHDGTEYPAGWPDRTDGCIIPPATSDCSWGPVCANRTLDASECGARTFRDTYTREVAQHAVATLQDLTGADPSVVVNHVHRSKLDANREVAEAAQGFGPAVQAWEEYHASIGNLSRMAVSGRCNSALVLDMHGQAHLHGWVEVGYSLSSSKLSTSDAGMSADPSAFQRRSTVRHAARTAAGATQPYSFTSLLRDTPAAVPSDPALRVSLGGLLEDAGFASVPSPARPNPDGQSYFSGGYTSQRWSSRDAAPGSDLYRVDAIQVEMPRWIRWGNSSIQERFGAALGHAVFHWVQRNHGVELSGVNACWAPPTPSPQATVSPTATASPAASISSTASASPVVLPSSGGTASGNSAGGKSAGGLGTGAVVGIALGGVVVLCLGVTAWYFAVYRPHQGAGKVKQGTAAGDQYELASLAEKQPHLVAQVSPIHKGPE